MLQAWSASIVVIYLRPYIGARVVIKLSLITQLFENKLYCDGFRPGSFDQPHHPMVPHEPGGLLLVRKSQDAAVGALVQMLKKAPPLRQDVSSTADLLQDSKLKTPTNFNQDSNEISENSNKLLYTSTNLASSGLISSKTTSDALDELRGYRELKDMLLKQGKISQQ